MDQSIRIVTSALEALADTPRAMTIGQVAIAVGISKQNASQLLSSLVALGYVKQSTVGNRFTASMKLWEVGSGVDLGDDLVRAAAPHIRRLATASDTTVQLAVFDKGYAVYVDQVYGKGAAKSIRLGSRSPASTVSAGKALLAWLSDKEFDQAMKLVKPFTPLTQVEPADIQRDLKETRKRGYAINRGEFRVGVGGFAVPIFDRRNRVIGALSHCKRPVQPLLAASTGHFILPLVDAAATISRALGSTKTPI